MDYNRQKIFLKKYHLVGLLFALALIGSEIALSWRDDLDLFQIVFNGVLTIGLIYAVIYLPKYLHLTIEPAKKYFWTVRIRWILIALLIIAGYIFARHENFYYFGKAPPFYDMVGGLIVAATLLLIVNLIVRNRIKRAQNKISSLRWLANIYAIADAVALFALIQSYDPNKILSALLVGLAAHLAIQLNALMPMGIFLVGLLASIEGRISPAIAIFLLVGIVSHYLTWSARRQNNENRAQTVAELAAFTKTEPEIIEDLLITSTGKLAADWHQKQPQGRAAVEAWYRDNSQYYIYDLAQYHLAYKHIVFTLDVMQLARGRVLDYGAGIGDLILALAARGHAATYFDVEGQSKSYARWQAEQRNIKLNFASAHAELTGASFDTIIVLDVLEHLFEPEETLEFLLSKLADGGLLIASAYFGATKSHPMHFDHKMDVAQFLVEHGLRDVKSFYIRWLGSEAMRRRPMFVYRKDGAAAKVARPLTQTAAQ